MILKALEWEAPQEALSYSRIEQDCSERIVVEEGVPDAAIQVARLDWLTCRYGSNVAKVLPLIAIAVRESNANLIDVRKKECGVIGERVGCCGWLLCRRSSKTQPRNLGRKNKTAASSSPRFARVSCATITYRPSALVYQRPFKNKSKYLIKYNLILNCMKSFILGVHGCLRR